MLHKLRRRVADERGFTLIELLVVILIIGILAAIALPAFLNQREKAQDTEAKSAVRTAQTALETYYTDNQNYSFADNDAAKDKLEAIEPALKSAFGTANLDLKVVSIGTGGSGYTVTAKSKGTNHNYFQIKNDAGTVTRSCGTTAPSGAGAPSGSGNGGCSTGSW